MSHSQDHAWGETESPSKGNREPLLGSKEEKGTAQSLSQRSSWFVWRMSPVGREAGLGAKKVMSQENRAACHREDQQDHGGELGKEGGGTVHDKASNPWFPRWENGRNSSHLSGGVAEIRNGRGAPAQNMCPRTECHCVPITSLPPRAQAADAAFRGATSDPLSPIKWKFVAGSVSETGRVWAAPSEKSRAAPKAKQ